MGFAGTWAASECLLTLRRCGAVVPGPPSRVRLQSTSAATSSCVWQPPPAARWPTCGSSLPHVSRIPQTVLFHKHTRRLHIDLLGAQAIVFVTNLLTGSRSRLARNTGEATGFMAEFHALFYTNCRYQKQAKSHFIFYFSQFNIQ